MPRLSRSGFVRFVGWFPCRKRRRAISRPIGSEGFLCARQEASRFRSAADRGSQHHIGVSGSLPFHDDATWHEEARIAFEWFLGRNDLGLSLYDSTTGAVVTDCTWIA